MSDTKEALRKKLAAKPSTNGPVAPKDSPFPEPIPLSQLVSVDLDAAWRLKGLLGVGSITLLSALWKCGKTVFVSHLLRAFAGELSFIGQDVTPCGVLVISEEPAHLWTARRDDLGIGDHVRILCRPFAGKPDWTTWKAFLVFLASHVAGEGIQIVVFDTITSVWPTVNENDASEVLASLLPIRQLCDVGAGVLLIHHPRKSDGTEATAARGSGALSGFVDIILELRRFDAAQRDDRRRVLTGYSRYASTPDELVIELAVDGGQYSLIGTKSNAQRRALEAIILSMLPIDPPGFSYDDIKDNWPNDRRPGKPRLLATLRDGAGQCWNRLGEGVKNKPYTYYAKGI